MLDFLGELDDLMPHSLSAQPGFSDAYGAFVDSGAAVAVQCQIEGVGRLVRDTVGREVVSSRTAYCRGAFALTVDGHRYTLPPGFSLPRERLVALRVETLSDEAGILYEVVSFP